MNGLYAYIDGLLHCDVDTGCLIWPGSNSDDSTRFQFGGKRWNARRVIWERSREPLNGRVLRPLCQSRQCVNPEHFVATGRRDTQTEEEYFWSCVGRGQPDACWEWMKGRFGQGYGAFNQSVNGELKLRKAHRCAWEYANNRQVPGGLAVCHKCDNPPCCNPKHLFIGTRRDNAKDREAKGRGRHVAGEKHGLARLTCGDVETVRKRRQSGERVVDLAAEYGVSVGHMYGILSGRFWQTQDSGTGDTTCNAQKSTTATSPSSA